MDGLALLHHGGGCHDLDGERLKVPHVLILPSLSFNVRFNIQNKLVAGRVNELVLGRFLESSPAESILLAIFAGEREESSL
jgi:hypothetical protein